MRPTTLSHVTWSSPAQQLDADEVGIRGHTREQQACGHDEDELGRASEEDHDGQAGSDDDSGDPDQRQRVGAQMRLCTSGGG